MAAMYGVARYGSKVWYGVFDLYSIGYYFMFILLSCSKSSMAGQRWRTPPTAVPARFAVLTWMGSLPLRKDDLLTVI